MQLLDILSKPVLSLYNGTTEGTIINVCFSSNLKKMKYCIIASEYDVDNDDEMILETKNVYKFGDDAVIIKNNGNLELKTNLDGITYCNNPINSSAYDTNGKFLGKITDVTLDKNLNVVEFITNFTKKKFEELVSFSSGTMIFQNGQTIIKASSFKPVVTAFGAKKSIVNQNVRILTIGDDPIKESGTVESKKYELKENAITRLTTKSNLLLGRRVKRTIQAQNGEIVAREGNTITNRIISLANNHQKLRELALYSE